MIQNAGTDLPGQIACSDAGWPSRAGKSSPPRPTASTCVEGKL